MSGLKHETKEWIKKHNEGFALGIPEEEIKQLEQKYHITLPKAYKEFLALTGQYFEPIRTLGHEFEYLDEIQSLARENLKEFDLEHLMPKRWWVIAEADGSEVIWYIDLDQGDDPPVYGLNMVDYSETKDPQWYKKITDSFSEWIEKRIRIYREMQGELPPEDEEEDEDENLAENDGSNE